MRSDLGRANLDELFRDSARRQPDAVAVFSAGPSGNHLTYAALDARVEAAAQRLREAGVEPGSCVALHVKSGVEYIVCAYAIWRCDATTVPIAVELSNAEKRDILERIAIDFVIAGADEQPILDRREIRSESALGHAAQLQRLQRYRSHPPEFSKIDAAFIRFTSGTTGTCKGVVLSHETVLERIRAANEVLSIGSDDRVVWLLSMSYHFTVTIVGYLTFGAGIILPDNNLADAVYDATSRHGGTVIYASPLLYKLLAAHPAGQPLPNLRLAISTTTALTQEIADRFHRRYRTPLSQALGLIEVGLPFINFDANRSAPTSVGRLLPAYQMKLKPYDDTNEIMLRGPGILDAYYSPWATREEIMEDGWFNTHDNGYVDPEGFVFLVGRSKDLIAVGGLKFFPSEVEAVLESHPSVLDACVFGVPHSRLGEVPAANIVVEVDEASTPQLAGELRNLCRQQVSSHKVPRRIEFVAEIRQTASGKALRRSPGPSNSGGT